eukprot:NODE_8067_length_425_cov_90.933511_g7205_i0.p1 GENE.NODE_8067_length_425_cov_90.933511_g7205_i0~~NODE_8067_length_425_cov_90.933511_g7205_i0.p1  ORF type:complete len:118 (-),score=34.96 NODE_8067_length_425_cov_90.933511_g7205_i0:71-382(-)
MVDGDGTIPLLGLGYMCVKGWRPGGSLNPHGTAVVTREYQHEALPLLHDMRSGPRSGDHVDIMGNYELITDIVQISTGNVGSTMQRIHSDIHQITSRVDLGSH